MATTWDLDALTLRQRDVLILLCNTNTGSAILDISGPSGHVTLLAARSLAKLGIIGIDSEHLWPEYIVSLTADGERWLLSLPEGALTTL